MRKLILAFAFLAAALGISHGQPIGPQTLPPNTIVGRLGAGQAGPAQAIPLATLSAQIFGGLYSSTSLLVGGSLANSTLSLESTSGVGTSDFVSILTGSQKEAIRVDTKGLLTVSQAGLGAVSVGGFPGRINNWNPNGSLFYDLLSMTYNAGTNGGVVIGASRGIAPGTFSTTLINDEPVALFAAGDNGSTYIVQQFLGVDADGIWSGSNNPTRVRLFTTSPSSAAAAERVRIDSNGYTTIGGSSNQDAAVLEINNTSVVPWNLAINNWNANSNAVGVLFAFSRGTTIGSQVLVQNNDVLGNLFFDGSTGTSFVSSAELKAEVDGVASASSMPGRFRFLTTPAGSTGPPNEVMRLDSKRHINYSSAAPTASACTGFALGTGSSDTAGSVTFNSATSCAISFGASYTNAPFCTVTPGSAASTVEATTTTGVLTATFGTAQTAMFYHCYGS